MKKLFVIAVLFVGLAINVAAQCPPHCPPPPPPPHPHVRIVR